MPKYTLKKPAQPTDTNVAPRVNVPRGTPYKTTPQQQADIKYQDAKKEYDTQVDRAKTKTRVEGALSAASLLKFTPAYPIGVGASLLSAGIDANDSYKAAKSGNTSEAVEEGIGAALNLVGIKGKGVKTGINLLKGRKKAVDAAIYGTKRAIQNATSGAMLGKSVANDIEDSADAMKTYKKGTKYIRKASRGLQAVAVPEQGSLSNVASSTASMAAAGASVGGPWGAVIGAGVGAVTGFIQKGKQDKANKEAVTRNKVLAGNRAVDGFDESIDQKTQVFKKGGRVGTKVIEIEGKTTPEIHTDKNFNIKNLGQTPHSKGGDKVVAAEGDIVFNTQNSLSKFNKIASAIEDGDHKTLHKEKNKLPEDTGMKKQQGVKDTQPGKPKAYLKRIPKAEELPNGETFLGRYPSEGQGLPEVRNTPGTRRAANVAKSGKTMAKPRAWQNTLDTPSVAKSPLPAMATFNGKLNLNVNALQPNPITAKTGEYLNALNNTTSSIAKRGNKPFNSVTPPAKAATPTTIPTTTTTPVASTPSIAKFLGGAGSSMPVAGAKTPTPSASKAGKSGGGGQVKPAMYEGKPLPWDAKNRNGQYGKYPEAVAGLKDGSSKFLMPNEASSRGLKYPYATLENSKGTQYKHGLSTNFGDPSIGDGSDLRETPKPFEFADKNMLAAKTDTTATNDTTPKSGGNGMSGANIAAMAGVANNLFQGLKKEKPIDEKYFDPQLIEYKDRSQSLRQASTNATVQQGQNARNVSGGSAANLRANQTAAAMGNLGRQNAIDENEMGRADAINAQNVGIKNAAGQYNLQRKDGYQAQMAAQTAQKQAYMDQAAADIGQYGMAKQEEAYMRSKDDKANATQLAGLKAINSNTQFKFDTEGNRTFDPGGTASAFNPVIGRQNKRKIGYAKGTKAVNTSKYKMK